MKKICVVCDKVIDTKEEPYFKMGTKYICDDSVNVECIITFCAWNRKNEDKTD